MKGLVLRLTQLDADAADSVRVIGFFDELLQQRANLDVVMRNAAELAQCPVGFSSPNSGVSLQAEPGTGPTPSRGVPSSAAVKHLDDGTMVWLARAGNPVPQDAMLLERLAIVVAIRLEHASVPPPQLGDPALVEQVLSAHPNKRALQLLRFDTNTTLRVLATTDPTAIEGPAAKQGSTWAILRTGPTPESLPRGTRLGVGPRVPATETARSWHAAHNALRFTTASEPIVHAEQLGCLAVLADHLNHTDLAESADLAALDQLDAESGGELLTVLNVRCATPSNRQAAEILHRHHSTIQPRICRAEQLLGFSLDTPANWFRLQLALKLRALRENLHEEKCSPN